jgi:hypothetical protein
MLTPREQLVELQSRHIALAEWHVLSLIGMWPTPVDQVAAISASHSEGDLRGSVTASECMSALEACVTKKWLIVVDRAYVKRCHSLVRRRKYIGPVYGYPKLGDVDFSSYGANMYKRIFIKLFGRHWSDPHGYRLKKNHNLRYFFRSKRAASAAIAKWISEGVLVFANKITAVGPWCVYWWKPFARGYSVDVRLNEPQ